mgnify:CR=1 FL=1
MALRLAARRLGPAGRGRRGGRLHWRSSGIEQDHPPGVDAGPHDELRRAVGRRQRRLGAGLAGDWFELAGKHADDLSELLEPMFLLNGMLKEDVEKSGERWFSPAEEARLVADIQENLPLIVQTLYNFWRNKRTGGTVRNAESKSGRNDPCPCGSGRKFKQCCGRPDKLN